MSVAPGEVVGVMGHNGSGKSTLLRVVSTVLKPNAGEGWIYGHHLVRDAMQVRKLIGFLAHSPGLYDDLSARENLSFAAAMLDVDAGPIDATLERVGLSRERDERVRGYSAGMQRRLALARVLLGQPRLLLLDEPYNNFDAQGIALVNEVILETRERGGAALVVLHDRRQGEVVLDRVIELTRGVVSERDHPEATAVPRPAVVAQGAR
jgi:heme exporter protein A